MAAPNTNRLCQREAERVKEYRTRPSDSAAGASVLRNGCERVRILRRCAQVHDGAWSAKQEGPQTDQAKLFLDAEEPALCWCHHAQRKAVPRKFSEHRHRGCLAECARLTSRKEKGCAKEANFRAVAASWLRALRVLWREDDSRFTAWPWWETLSKDVVLES